MSATFKIVDIRQLEGSIGELPPTLQKPAGFKHKYKLSFIPRADVKQILVKLKVETFSKAEEKLLGTFTAGLGFEISNFEEDVTVEDGKITRMNEVLREVLASVTYSTTRGMMYQFYKGSILQQAVLPIIDPKKLISKKVSPAKGPVEVK